MANPKENPRQFLLEAALNPNDPTLPANRDAVACIDKEINRIQAIIDKLEQCKANLKRRMKAA